jgi:short chain dehydrogenase
MIERKRGHIVAIASLGSKITFPFAIGYCATKFGVKGFMEALYDELCFTKVDDFIKLTTVYPAHINTRKEFVEVMDQAKEASPRMSPEYVAEEVVRGILLNKSDVTLPYGISNILLVVKYDRNFIQSESYTITSFLLTFQLFSAKSHEIRESTVCKPVPSNIPSRNSNKLGSKINDFGSFSIVLNQFNNSHHRK